VLNRLRELKNCQNFTEFGDTKKIAKNVDKFSEKNDKTFLDT
jgi:hypothetical protein